MDAESPPSKETDAKASPSSANLSDLVKEMVKEMDANDFYSRNELYDDSAEERWFNIDITLVRGKDAPAIPGASLRKPWSEFQRLHYLLLTDEFGCNEEVKRQLPALPPGPAGLSTGGGSGGSGSGETAKHLDVYLKALLAVPVVVQSHVFSGFLEERGQRRGVVDDEEKADGVSGSSGAERGSRDTDVSGGGVYGEPRSRRRNPETAIDFLLQPFDYGKAYVPRRADFTDRIDVIRGESVVWKFEVMDHMDIDFSVVFRPHPVAVPSRPSESETTNSDQGATWMDFEGEGSSPGPRDVVRKESPEPSDSSNVSAGASTNEGTRRRRWWRMGAGGGNGDPEKGEADVGLCEEPVVKDGMPRDQTVHLPTRYSTGEGDAVQGSFTCPADGTCILRWDNSYSRLRGKRLCFVMESATVQTMRAAIEAAGAVDHKRRATRSAAAQTILDSGDGEATVSVTAVGASDKFDCEEDDGEKRTGSGERPTGGAEAAVAGGGDGTIYYSRHYSFGRVRRVAAALLRDLGTIVDARQTPNGCGRGGNGATAVDDGDGSGGGCSGPTDGGGVASDRIWRSGSSGNVDAQGVETLVARFEVLEDEVASISARRAQSEAQAKVLLATLQKANTKADRLERNLDETQELLSKACGDLQETGASRDAATAAEAAANARLQASEEQLLRAKRERDLLQAERSVWQVARSGIQEELAKVVGELELERHRHEDTSRALAKSHESRAHAEAEAARLSRRLEEERGGAGGARAALVSEREAARLAREEAEDARTAVAELDAAVAELGAQKRVLVAGLRARERDLGDRCAAAEARAEEASMMRRAAETRARELEEDSERREAAQADAEVRLQRLRAEKKVLLAEVRRGVGGGGGGSGGFAGGGGGKFEASTIGISGAGERGGDGEGDDGSEGSVVQERGRDSGGSGDRWKGSVSPRSSTDSSQDNKTALKQLSRQLVHLRERQHHLREDLRADPSNASALRLEADVDRAVQNLETRIRRLLSTVAGMEGEAGSVGSPPTAASTTRRSVAATESWGVAEVDTFSV